MLACVKHVKVQISSTVTQADVFHYRGFATVTMTAGTTRMNEIAVSDNFFLFLLFISTLQYQSGLYVACLFAV